MTTRVGDEEVEEEVGEEDGDEEEEEKEGSRWPAGDAVSRRRRTDDHLDDHGVGESVGWTVKGDVGVDVGSRVGSDVGSGVGPRVGSGVGTCVGSGVGLCYHASAVAPDDRKLFIVGGETDLNRAFNPCLIEFDFPHYEY